MHVVDILSVFFLWQRRNSFLQNRTIWGEEHDFLRSEERDIQSGVGYMSNLGVCPILAKMSVKMDCWKRNILRLREFSLHYPFWDSEECPAACDPNLTQVTNTILDSNDAIFEKLLSSDCSHRHICLGAAGLGSRDTETERERRSDILSLTHADSPMFVSPLALSLKNGILCHDIDMYVQA